MSFKNHVHEKFEENDKVIYQGKEYEVYGWENKMLILVSSNGSVRYKVLPQEVKKVVKT